MQSILKNRPVHVLCELLAAVALLAMVWLGSGCGQESAVARADDRGIRISLLDAVDRVAAALWPEPEVRSL